METCDPELDKAFAAAERTRFWVNQPTPDRLHLLQDIGVARMNVPLGPERTLNTNEFIYFAHGETDRIPLTSSLYYPNCFVARGSTGAVAAAVSREYGNGSADRYRAGLGLL